MSASLMPNIAALPFVLPIQRDAAWFTLITNGVDPATSAALGPAAMQAIGQMIGNALHATAAPIMDYHKRIAELFVNHITQMEQHIDQNFPNNTQMSGLRTLINEDRATLAGLTAQINQIPNTSGSVHARHPKLADPPEFNGTDGKVKFTEWLNKLNLWLVHEKITSDAMKITAAMGKLSGAAASYMEPWIEALTTGQTLGTWAEFLAELKVQYGQKDEKEGAKKEITALFNNTDLARKNFIKYAEKFRTLGRLSGYTDGLLIEKLELVIDQPMRLALIGRMGHLPNTWGKYLDLLLELYKRIFPEKAQGHIFGKISGNSDAMEVDAATKQQNKAKSGKAKGKKEANSTDVKAKKRCGICNYDNHDITECYYNGKTNNKKPGFKDEKNGKEKKKDWKKPAGNRKYIRSAEDSDDSDDTEVERTPKASSSKLNISTAQTKSAYIEEEEDTDEQSPTQPAQDKSIGKKKQLGGKDFLWGTM